MGPIYDGLLHFLTSPEDLVPVLALALFAGLRGVRYGREARAVRAAGGVAAGRPDRIDRVGGEREHRPLGDRVSSFSGDWWRRI
jgi:hypothetical protein